MFAIIAANVAADERFRTAQLEWANRKLIF